MFWRELPAARTRASFSELAGFGISSTVPPRRFVSNKVFRLAQLAAA